jgi:SAM-dependent methyltransferase
MIADDTEVESGTIRALVRLLAVVGFGAMITLFVIFALGIQSRPDDWGLPQGALTLIKGAAVIGAALIGTSGLFHGLRKLAPTLDANALAQAQFLDTLNLRYVDRAILLSAALSLFLEMALIRWQSSVLQFLAFYKNFSLLACFAGLGLGYALATRTRLPLLMVAPLLAAQFCFVLLVRAASSNLDTLDVNPFREQLTMGLSQANWVEVVVLFVLLSVIFLLTALTFVPIGQLCGRLMERRNNLRAYGLNLLGSLLGVLIMLLASVLWTPPLVWFALCLLAILLFHSRRPSSLIAGIVFSAVCTVVLAWWPIEPLWSRVYSPYQLIEIGADQHSGLTMIRAAGHYYQTIRDVNGRQSGDDSSYYDYPYKAHPVLTDVAIVGSGTGNDVAAALRAGAERVDAIEIDPVIMRVGKERHPDNPYSDPSVRAINNDARSFLRQASDHYDLIVYGLLDSHTLLSHGSSVRLDSFVYTIEGLREARSRLKPDGVISLSFTVLSEALGRKIFLMMQEAFDGRVPLCLRSSRDNTTFLMSNDERWRPPAGLMSAKFEDVTAKYANSTEAATVSTDDWPFFYMPQRVYPKSYLIMIALILLLSLLLVGNFIAEAPRFSHLSFFFLGAGFMLIETKGITEMGLTFGNTWQVISVVFAGMLIMAFIGNCLVQWLSIKRPLPSYVFLLAALAVGWLAARSGGFASTPIGRIETATLLSLPLLFSGIVFSTLLSAERHISGLMAMNLMGAIVGGLLEYNSMYLGFQALYLMAMLCYLLAFAADWTFMRKDLSGAKTPYYGANATKILTE